MADLSLFLQLESRLVGPAGLEILKKLVGLRMQQIKVEVFHAAVFQLLREELADALRAHLEHAVGELVGNQVALARVAAGQAGPQCLLALAAMVAVGRVKIVEAVLQEIVDHGRHLFDINLSVLFRQSHAAESEILLYFRENLVHYGVFCLHKGR